MRDDHDKVGFQDLMSPTTVRSRLTGKRSRVYGIGLGLGYRV